MNKFKVGDKVRIVKPWNIDRGYINDIVTITEVKQNGSGQYRYNVKENNRPWVDDELEHVNGLGEQVCAYQKSTEYIDDYKIYIKGIWGIKEENEMRNEVLELWYEKKRNKVIDKYEKLEKEFNKTQYSVVESFNELVEKFNNDLEDLYKLDKVSEQFVLEENAPSNVYKYRIDYDKLRDEFVEKYITERNKELAKIEEKYKEVKAQLSLSDNLDYQIDILTRYGILTKKDKKISE